MPDRGDRETFVMQGVAANDNGEATARVDAAEGRRRETGELRS